MVLFASWRPKFRKVVLCTIIISALASAGSEIQELKSYDQAKAAYSEILELDQVRQKNEKAVKAAYKLLKKAVEMKNYAEELSKKGKAEESKEAYMELLKLDKQIVELLTIPYSTSGDHIALAKNNIIRIKTKLEGNKFFDPNRVDIRELEGNIYNAWLEIDKLTKSVSNEVQEVERTLGIID